MIIDIDNCIDDNTGVDEIRLTECIAATTSMSGSSGLGQGCGPDVC